MTMSRKWARQLRERPSCLGPASQKWQRAGKGGPNPVHPEKVRGWLAPFRPLETPSPSQGSGFTRPTPIDGFIPSLFLSLYLTHEEGSSAGMASVLLAVGTSPFLTAPVLWSLTSAPPSIRRPLLAHLERLLTRHGPAFATPRRIVQSLACLVGVGVVRQLNAWLNAFALNHWRLFSDRTRWRWSEEIAVVTGGSGGIGALIVDKLASRGIRVVILDVHPPTGTRR
jgi:hypothetical protein